MCVLAVSAARHGTRGGAKCAGNLSHLVLAAQTYRQQPEIRIGIVMYSLAKSCQPCTCRMGAAAVLLTDRPRLAGRGAKYVLQCRNRVHLGASDEAIRWARTEG